MDKKYALDFEKPLRELSKRLEALHQLSAENDIDVSSEIQAIEAKIEQTKRRVYSNLTPWQRVQLARHPFRPYALDYIDDLFEDFQELSGDRSFRDDPAIVGGPAYLDGAPVMVIGTQKGREVKEKVRRNFGMPNPEGYRKALRLMRLAEKFGLPVVTLVDTPGAFPGLGSEERHVSEAIAVNLREMSQLKTPVVAAIIGEGGSGGALGLAVADCVLILENAYYSVISPEGCAAILWKDAAAAAQAAAALKFGAKDLLGLNVVEEIVPEPMGGAQNDPDAAGKALKKAVQKRLRGLQRLKLETLLEKRYQRFRKLGAFEESAAAGNLVPIDEAAS